jgi:hypothetical protein
MRHHRLHALAAALTFVLIAGSSLAYAQNATTVDFPFQFVAGGQTHVAGKYEVRLNEDRMGVTLVPAKGTPNVLLSITRLAPSEKASPEGRVVFDKVGNTYYLSEVWLPGEDGFLLYAEKGVHQHHSIKLPSRLK